MSLSLSKFKTLKRTSIFGIIFLSIIFLFAIGYQNRAMAASCADCSRCKGARVYGNISNANTGGKISGATVTVTTTATSGVQCPSTSSSKHGWCGPKSGSTTTNSTGYYNFARIDGLYCFVNCGWGYSAPWKLSVSHPNYYSNSTTFSPINGSASVVNLSLRPKSSPTITCWSCNTSNYTCYSQSYSGTSCPSGTYSSQSSCQNNCQQSTITCWSCNTSNYTCYSQTYNSTYCPSGTYGTYSSQSSCQNNCQQSTITCWSCNTSNYTCYSHTYSGYYCPSGTYSSRSSCEDDCEDPQIKCWYCSNYTCYSHTYSGYYCPSGTYSSRSSCEDDCEEPSYSILNVSKTVRNITDNTTFRNSVSADPLDRLEFKIKVSSTGSTKARSVIVKDTLPWQITYQNKLKINGVSSSGKILTGLNLGTVYPGQSKTITFEAKVASADKFIYGITTLTNTAMAYNADTEDTDTSKIVVTRKAVAGAVTEIKTGIVSRALDYVLFPLTMTFIIILVFKNYLIFLNEWLEKGKSRMIEHRSNRSLRRIISRIKSRERF